MNPQIDIEKYIANLPKKVQNVIFDDAWETRTREIGAKYSLSDNQIEGLVNTVLLVLVGMEKAENLLENIVSDTLVSRFIAEQIYNDLDKRVFEYVANLVESVKEESKPQTTYSNIPNSIVPSAKTLDSDAQNSEAVSVPRYAGVPTPLTPQPLSSVIPKSDSSVQNVQAKPEAKKSHDKSFAGRYSRVMKISQDQYWDLYENLPEILRVIFVSSELSSEIDDIAKVNRLNEEQTKSLVSLMGDIILDIQDDQNQEALISKYLGVDSYVSKKIAFSLKNRVTENAEGLYKKIQSNIEKESADINKVSPTSQIPRPEPISVPKQNYQTPVLETQIELPGKKKEVEIKYRPAQAPLGSAQIPLPNNYAPIPREVPTEKPRSILSDEALNKPLGQTGQSSGSRPFGAVNKPSAFTDESNFSKPLNSNPVSKIVFAKQNPLENSQNIPGWNTPEKSEPNNINSRYLDREYSPDPRQQTGIQPNIINAQNNLQGEQKVAGGERPAFTPKFGNTSFNDPLKEQQSTPVTRSENFSNPLTQEEMSNRLSNIYNQLNYSANNQQTKREYTPPQYRDEYREPQGDNIANEKLNNSTYARIENSQNTPITHEYVVDPYREPTE